MKIHSRLEKDETPKRVVRWKNQRNPFMVEIHPAENLELIDGVKIINAQNDNWVLILPDAGEPLVHIFANSEDRDWVDDSLKEYRQRVQEFIDREQGGESTHL